MPSFQESLLSLLQNVFFMLIAILTIYFIVINLKKSITENIFLLFVALVIIRHELLDFFQIPTAEIFLRGIEMNLAAIYNYLATIERKNKLKGLDLGDLHFKQWIQINLKNGWQERKKLMWVFILIILFLLSITKDLFDYFMLLLPMISFFLFVVVQTEITIWKIKQKRVKTH